MGCAASSLALALMIGLFEIGLRIGWTPPADKITRTFEFKKYLVSDPEVGYIPRPNTLVEYPYWEAAFKTNSRGLRGGEVALARQPGHRRVVVLGDSFAWGHGISENNAFPEYLEQALTDCEVINLGVPGFDLPDSLAYYKRLGAAYQPDVVLLALCQNDVRDHKADQRRRDLVASLLQNGAEKNSSVPALRRIKKRLCQHSYVFSLIRNTINTRKPLARAAVRIGLKEKLAGFEMLDDNLRPALVHYPETMQTAIAQLKLDILKIESVVRAQGGRFLLVLIPALQAVDHDAFVRSIAYTHYEVNDFDIDKPYDIIRQFAKSHNISVISPLPSFREAFERGRPLYLKGDLHFNEAGHRLFAECITPELDRLLQMRSDTSRLSNRSLDNGSNVYVSNLTPALK